MTYNVRFTDNDKSPITVYDNTANNDTSLVFPGRNVTNYGSIIAENFLHLLENFSSATAPESPIEGQLWYDSEEETLRVSDGVTWRAASGIYKDSVEPSLLSSKAGELWIDTVNQQLKIFNGTNWVLIGPNQTSINGLRYGPTVETITDTDNILRPIITLYIADVPIVIVSKDSFTPKITIAGFNGIRAGININYPRTAADASRFDGGYLPKLIGTATAAESLIIEGSNTVIPAAQVLRTNVSNTVEKEFKVRNNTGIIIGENQNFNLASGVTGARIYNSTQNGSISLQINRNGIPDTILKVQENRVGINNQNPEKELDIIGDQRITGTIVSSNISESTNINNGSIVTAGGISIARNLRVGTNAHLNETVGTFTETRELRPRESGTFNLGRDTHRWNEVHAKKIVADSIEGVLVGNISGKAQLATALENVTEFELTGDVVSQVVRFDGQVGGYSKKFNTELTANLITGKNEPPGGVSLKSDQILIYRAGSTGSAFSGLLKQTRDNFIADLGIPIGAILPYAGVNPPSGFLFCDGSEVQKVQYPDLYAIIGDYYNGAEPLVTSPFNTTFRLPDLRGRFPLGRDNMDNGGTVPLPTGGTVNAGGGTANRVTDSEASVISGAKGSSTKTLNLENIPDHSHSLTASNGQQFYAVRNDPAVEPGTIAGAAGTATGQARLLADSGTVTKPTAGFVFGRPFDAMNPYLTINYIIRSGPPVFTVT